MSESKFKLFGSSISAAITQAQAELASVLDGIERDKAKAYWDAIAQRMLDQGIAEHRTRLLDAEIERFNRAMESIDEIG